MSDEELVEHTRGFIMRVYIKQHWDTFTVLCNCALFEQLQVY